MNSKYRLIGKMRFITKLHAVSIAILSLFSINGGYAQVTQSDYFMETSYLRNSLNPALRPEQGYLVVPILPTIGANGQTNKINLHNFTFKGPDGKRVTFMHQSVGVEQFLSKLSYDNYANADVNIKFFGLGFYKGDHFWNIDMGVRTHADVNIPKPFFELLKRGFGQEEQSTYDLSDLHATGYSFIEIGVAHSRMFMDNNLTLGARVKFLGGLADFKFDTKSLNIDAGPDYWKAKSKASLIGSAPGVAPRYDEKGNLDGFTFGNFNLPGLGLGIDLGAVYDVKELFPVLEGLKISAAINDIGFISWSKANTINLQSPETEVIVSPNDYSIYERDGSSVFDVFEDALDDIKKAVNLKGETKRARASMLRMNMNLGAEYELVRDKLTAGALYSIRFGSYSNISEFTLSANYRPCTWFATSLTYSVNHSQFDTFGLALHIVPSKGLNLFLASDYATPHISSDFVPTTSRALNFQFGISIPLGERRK